MTVRRDWMYVSGGSGPSMLAIEDAVIEVTRVARRELHSDYMDDRITAARAILYYIAHDYGGYSWPAIGRHMGRDHSTVLTMAKRAKSRPSLADAVADVKMRVGIYGGLSRGAKRISHDTATSAEKA